MWARDALKIVSLVLVFASLGRAQTADVHWLDGAPKTAQGVSFGVPWAQGKVAKGTQFVLSANRKQIPSQTWDLAYWPDGSLKWTGVAVVGNSELDQLTLAPGKSEATDAGLKVKQTDIEIEIANGATTYHIPKSGDAIVSSIEIGGRAIASHGELICSVGEESFGTELNRVTLEQSGPVRAVAKLEGFHKSPSRKLLPFTVRLYFFADAAPVRMVHSFIFDGDQEKDFIHSLGVRFDVPMRDEVHNRHIRIAGDTGMFAEPVRVIAGRRMPSMEFYLKQAAGEADSEAGGVTQPATDRADGRVGFHSSCRRFRIWGLRLISGRMTRARG